MKRTIPLSVIKSNAVHRPEGYYEDVIAHGRVVGGTTLELDEVEYQKLCRKYRPQMPSFYEMTHNFVGAMTEWVQAGFPVVSNDQFTDRLEACEQCQFWLGNRCSKCGCFKLKMWLKTEICPIGKW